MQQIPLATMIINRFRFPHTNGRGLLPKLVENLIKASVKATQIKRLRFPSEDTIHLHGFDGVLDISDDLAHRHLPSGKSVWEVGTSQDYRKKANSDFKGAENKFKSISPEECSSDTTWIFVTPETFQDSEEWISQKKSGSNWKDIKIIDAVLLADWIAQCPEVYLWIAEECGYPISGLYNSEQYLKMLSKKYNLEISPELIIGGRNSQQELVTDRITNENTPFNIYGESPEEVASFIAACHQIEPESFADCPALIFADRTVNLNALAIHQAEMNIIPLDTETIKQIRFCRIPKWRVIVPKVETSQEGEVEIVLDRLRRAAVSQYLSTTGNYDSNEAHDIAEEAFGSLRALFRCLEKECSSPPAWATGIEANTYAMLMLLGSWNDGNENDIAVVEQITDKKYSDIEALLQMAKLPDGIWVHRQSLHQEFGTWHCAATSFVWLLLGTYIKESSRAKNKFCEIVQEVLGEYDPALELPPSERMFASIRGKKRRYSNTLRKGILESLVRMSIIDQDFADTVVYKLVNTEENVQRWLSLDGLYPELAEASPSVYLSNLESFIKSDNKCYIFQDNDSQMLLYNHSPHTSILWSIERLAWLPEYLPHVLKLLTIMASIDTSGRLDNRPIATFHTIVTPFLAQHGGSNNDIIDLLGTLYDDYPEVIWSLCVGLLPQNPGSILSYTKKPKYRLKTEKKAITRQDVFDFYALLTPLLIEWAGTNTSRIIELIEAYPSIYKNGLIELSSQIIQITSKLNTSTLSEIELYDIGTAFREIIADHQYFSDAIWALPSSEIEKLKQLQQAFVSADLVTQFKYLFSSYHPRIPNAPMKCTDGKWPQWIAQQRTAAANQIYQAHGLEGLYKLANEARFPRYVGLSISQLKFQYDNILNIIQQTLSDEPGNEISTNLRQCGYGFIYAMFNQNNLEWLEKILAEPVIVFSQNITTNIMLSLPPIRETWDIVERLSQEIQSMYWVHMRHDFSNLNDWAYIFDKYVEYQRNCSSVKLISYIVAGYGDNNSLEKPDATQCVNVLEGLLYESDGPEQFNPKDSELIHAIQDIFDYLDSVAQDDDRVSVLQWEFFPILKRSEIGLKTIIRSILQSPANFVHILSLVYKSDQNEDTKISIDPNTAKQAYELLKKINKIPGIGEDGNINGNILEKWISDSQSLAADCGRREVCDGVIGEILSYSPESSDGCWPPQEVCKALEKFGGKEMENGLSCGKFNQRGVYSICEKSEWELYEKFYAYMEKAKSWPRTHSVLCRLAEGYRKTAMKIKNKTKRDEPY